MSAHKSFRNVAVGSPFKRRCQENIVEFNDAEMCQSRDKKFFPRIIDIFGVGARQPYLAHGVPISELSVDIKAIWWRALKIFMRRPAQDGSSVVKSTMGQVKRMFALYHACL